MLIEDVWRWRSGVQDFVTTWGKSGWFYSHWGSIDQTQMFHFLLGKLILTYGRADMAKSGQNGAGKGTDWGGYVDRRLAVSEREEFMLWVCEFADVFKLIADLLWEGYRLSVSFDRGSKAFFTSLTGAGGFEDGKARTLTARAADLETALRLLIYKHTILLSGDWKDYSKYDGDVLE